MPKAGSRSNEGEPHVEQRSGRQARCWNASCSCRSMYLRICFFRMGIREWNPCGKQSWTERNAGINHNQSSSASSDRPIIRNDNRYGALELFWIWFRHLSVSSESLQCTCCGVHEENASNQKGRAFVQIASERCGGLFRVRRLTLNGDITAFDDRSFALPPKGSS
jgi:hypothetical protein